MPPDTVAKGGSARLLRTLDDQEARLLERLRAAHGEPVSFEELRAEGIENPGQVCYDLEIAGARIVHGDRRGHGGIQRVGVRLDEPDALEGPEPVDSSSGREQTKMAAAAAAAISAASAPPAQRLRASLVALHSRFPLPAPHIARRAAAPLLALAAVLVVTLALTDAGSSPSSPARVGLQERTRGGNRAATAQPTSRRSPPQRAPVRSAGHAPRARRVPISPTTAARVQLAGHQLLSQNDFAGAIRAMRTAIAASGQSLSGCRVPATQACLTYAYALYDLGHALRLAGHPVAAVPVLEARLQIDDQRQVVAYELGLARAQMRRGRL